MCNSPSACQPPQPSCTSLAHINMPMSPLLHTTQNAHKQRARTHKTEDVKRKCQMRMQQTLAAINPQSHAALNPKISRNQHSMASAQSPSACCPSLRLRYFFTRSITARALLLPGERKTIVLAPNFVARLMQNVRPRKKLGSKPVQRGL